MSSFDPKAALIAYHAALEARDFMALEHIFADDVEYVSAGIGVTRGRAALMQSLRDYFASHGDHHAWDEAVEALGPQMAQSHWGLVATDPASGQLVERRGVETLTFDGAGRVLRVAVSDEAGR